LKLQSRREVLKGQWHESLKLQSGRGVLKGKWLENLKLQSGRGVFKGQDGTRIGNFNQGEEYSRDRVAREFETAIRERNIKGTIAREFLQDLKRPSHEVIMMYTVKKGLRFSRPQQPECH
jgi:hypothetical protein